MLFACGSVVLPILSVFGFCAPRAQKPNTKKIRLSEVEALPKAEKPTTQVLLLSNRQQKES
jgi:hypothetical protein